MKALLLDLDNTLVDRDAAMLAWLATIVPPATPARDATIDALFQLDGGGYGAKAALYAALATVGGFSPAEARRRFTYDFPTFVRLRPDAEGLLAAFPGPKVIVTNGSGILQRNKIAAAGIEAVARGGLAGIVVSGELSAAADTSNGPSEAGEGGPIQKPHPAMFHAALARAGVAAADALMVGDHPVNDIAGALAVGIPAVFVRSRWFADPPGVPAIDRLTEVAG